MLSAKECKHYFKNDFILDFLKENDMQSSKFWHEGCSTHYKTWMLCYWAVLPSLCHLYKTAFSLLMPSKYSAQKTFQFHGLKAVLVRKNFCLKEMYKTISWGVGKPNMNIAIFIGGKKIVIKVALLTQGSPTLCLLILSPPSWIYLCKKTFLLLNLTTKEGGVLSLKRKQQPSTIFFYKSYIFLFFR